MLEVPRPDRLSDDECVKAWAGSGAMYLSGHQSGPPRVEPAGVVRALGALGRALTCATGANGKAVSVDPVALLAERAAFTGMGRNGWRSVGGSAQMLAAADGWVALNLPRPSDVAALGALAGGACCADDWPGIERELANLSRAEIEHRAGLLGLAVAALGASGLITPAGEVAAGAGSEFGSAPVATSRPWTVLVWNSGTGTGNGAGSAASGGKAACGSGVTGPAPGVTGGNRSPLVVDLTSLWAGPLAGSLLAAAGARVIKVESSGRPDGARHGPAAFFDLLNSNKQHLMLDLPEPQAVEQLRELLGLADLVLESSRPRVMQQWGISPSAMLEQGTSWVSITGHGRRGAAGNRVAFGDDAAVAGGLYLPGGLCCTACGSSRHGEVGSAVDIDSVGIDSERPLFVADAVADPIAGLAAAVVGARLLSGGHSALVDVALADAVRWVTSHAAGAIQRPVLATPTGWIVELPDGSAVDVLAPQPRMAAATKASVGVAGP